MTHPAYTRQQLQFLKLSELKAIAAQIGADIADKRIRASYIQAILDHSEIKVSESQPETKTIDITDYQTLCLNTTGTRTLHQLKNWCAAKQMLQGDDFGVLYRSIFDWLVGFPYPQTKQLDLTIGCIDQAIRDQAELSEKICDELGIDVIDLSVAYDDIVIPHGHDAYYAYYDGVKVASISTWNNSYISSKSNLDGCSDPYTAILETIHQGEVAIARAAVERERSVAALMPEYI